MALYSWFLETNKQIKTPSKSTMWPVASAPLIQSNNISRQNISNSATKNALIVLNTFKKIG